MSRRIGPSQPEPRPVPTARLLTGMRRPRRTIADAGGFTLVELLLVMVILGVLAGLALPHLQRAIIKARAAQVIGDLDVVRVASQSYHADYNDWPGDAGRGRIPQGLEEYLPEGFTFAEDDYTLDYDNWSRRGNRNRRFVGLTVVTSDQELGEAIIDLMGDANTWTNGRNKFTWVIEWI